MPARQPPSQALATATKVWAGRINAGAIASGSPPLEALYTNGGVPVIAVAPYGEKNTDCVKSDHHAINDCHAINTTQTTHLGSSQEFGKIEAPTSMQSKHVLNLEHTHLMITISNKSSQSKHLQHKYKPAVANTAPSFVVILRSVQKSIQSS
jgi:hypothetical protein